LGTLNKLQDEKEEESSLIHRSREEEGKRLFEVVGVTPR